MNASAPATWFDANQQHLMHAVAEVRALIEQFCGRDQQSSLGDRAQEPAKQAAPQPAMPEVPALEVICSVFELSSFERKILLMCAGVELDSAFAALFSSGYKDRRLQPTFGLALAAFKDAHWSALSPSGPLRHWQLVEVSSSEALTTSPLRIQERILHYLAGVPCLDERLQALVMPISASAVLVPSHESKAREAAAVWAQARSGSQLPIIELCGDDAAARRTVAAAACSQWGLRLHTLAARNLPAGNPTEVGALVRLWEREAILGSSALLLECDDADEAPFASSVTQFLEAAHTPVFVATRSPRRSVHRTIVVFDLAKPTPPEQMEIWRGALDHTAMNGSMQALVSQFSLSAARIQSAAEQAMARSHSTARDPNPESEDEELAEHLWNACRAQARPRLEGLAQRIEPVAGWDDLVLPERQKTTLRQIAIHVRQKARVYENWGFASKSTRGLGISALFAGSSGTGKTMAAEVLANELNLDLYKIDLSQVINKYIGETEKNLSRVFDAAEEGAAVLLFDEADALFGKRSEVKDSHDRYANIEVSYLLQRMETYRGLAILTTNRKSALDQAFMRRIRFVVEFPFPEPAERAEIWRRVFPAATPTEGLRVDRLARLNAAGGHIRNIAMGAAFLAADSGEPVRMSHLLSAARSEFAKLEKPLTEAEVAGWV